MAQNNREKLFDFLRQMLMVFSASFIRPNLIEIGLAQKNGIEELEVEVIEDIYYYPDFDSIPDLSNEVPKTLVASRGSRWKLNIQELDLTVEPLCFLCDPQVEEAFTFIFINYFFSSVNVALLGASSALDYPTGREPENNHYCFHSSGLLYSTNLSPRSSLFKSWEKKGFFKYYPKTHLKYASGREEAYICESFIIERVMETTLSDFGPLDGSDRLLEDMHRSLFSLANFLTQAWKERAGGVFRIAEMLNQASQVDSGRFNWMAAVTVPRRGLDTIVDNTEAGSLILREDLPEIAAGFWELFLEFAEKKPFFFNYQATEEEVQLQTLDKKNRAFLKLEPWDYDETKVKAFVFVEKPSKEELHNMEAPNASPFLRELADYEAPGGIHYVRTLTAGLDHIGLRAQGAFSERIVRIQADRVAKTFERHHRTHRGACNIAAALNRYILAEKQKSDRDRGLLDSSNFE